MADDPSVDVQSFEDRVTDMVIRLVVLGFFVYWSLSLIRPFLPIAAWGVVLAVALAPVHDWLAARIGGRRGLAAALITLLALVVVIGPVATLARNLVETVVDLGARANAGTLTIPAPPAFLNSLPLVGEQIPTIWLSASDNFAATLTRYDEFLKPVRIWVVTQLSTVSFDMLKFLVSIVVAGLLLTPGPALAAGTRRIAARIVAPRGEEFVTLAGQTIRNVSRGVVGVSLLQAVPIGVVLQVAGVPSAGMLAFVILLLCVIQLGPGLVVVPVLIWAWADMSTGHALLLTLLLVPLTVMDNVLKPILVGRGLATPTLIIFLGVVGGALSYGTIGLFLGPVVLGVFYDLVVSWTIFGAPVEEGDDIGSGAEPPASGI